MTRRVLTWIALAAVGIALAAGITFAAAHVAGSHVAIGPAPSGGVQLAPPATTTITVPGKPPQREDDSGRGDD